MKTLTKETSLNKSLKSGRVAIFSNAKHQEQICDDDIREARVYFTEGSSNWNTGYFIHFNGQLINQSKTFITLEKSLDVLCANWNLEFEGYE